MSSTIARMAAGEPSTFAVTTATKRFSKLGYTLTRSDPIGGGGFWRMAKEDRAFVSSDWHSVKSILARMEGGPTP